MDLVMDALEIEDVIQLATSSEEKRVLVDQVSPGAATVRVPFHKRMLRPGDIISGPALFAAADVAMWVAVMAHYGPVVMAVTANMNISFLDKAEPGDLIAEVRLLKQGRRLAVMDVELFSSADPSRRVAHATGSYAVPGRAALRPPSAPTT